MELSDCQRRAAETDQTPGTEGTALVIPLLGLAGEVGSLLAEYKKHLRDGAAHRLFRKQVSEDLGDLLWYVANCATELGLDMNEVASANLSKAHDRWPSNGPSDRPLFDQDSPVEEQLPRQFEIEIREY